MKDLRRYKVVLSTLDEHGLVAQAGYLVEWYLGEAIDADLFMQGLDALRMECAARRRARTLSLRPGGSST